MTSLDPKHQILDITIVRCPQCEDEWTIDPENLISGAWMDHECEETECEH